MLVIHVSVIVQVEQDRTSHYFQIGGREETHNVTIHQGHKRIHHFGTNVFFDEKVDK